MTEVDLRHGRGPASWTAIEVDVGGIESVRTAAFARRVMGELAARSVLPLWQVRVRVTRQWHAPAAHAFLAQANADLAGRRVRVQVRGGTPLAALELLASRLDRRLEWLARAAVGDWLAAPRLPSGPPAAERKVSPRSRADRQVVRHKLCTLAVDVVDHAAFDLVAQDYQFHLFTELGSRQTSVLYRAGPTGLRLAQLAPRGPHRLAPYRAPVTLSSRPAEVVTVAHAVALLERTDRPFQFFLDTDTWRGSAVYRRFDGDYGLLVGV